jgi:hypothetical protein
MLWLRVLKIVKGENYTDEVLFVLLQFGMALEFIGRMCQVHGMNGRRVQEKDSY